MSKWFSELKKELRWRVETFNWDFWISFILGWLIMVFREFMEQINR